MLRGDDLVVRNNRVDTVHDRDCYQIDGDNNLIEGNTATANTSDGFQVFGRQNTLQRNTATGNLVDGIHILGGGNGCYAPELQQNVPCSGNKVLDNQVLNNHGEGIENDGADTRIVGNTSEGNRTDCAGGGTVTGDSNPVGQCADGSDFDDDGEIDRPSSRGSSRKPERERDARPEART